MKILLVITNADMAGAPIHVLELIRCLFPLGIKFFLVSGEEGFLLEHARLLGIQTRVVSSMRSSINPAKDLRSINALRSVIAEFDPDLIHAHSSKAGFVSRVAGAITGVPVIYTVHGWGFGRGRRKHISALVYISEWIMKSFTKKIITVSDVDRITGLSLLKIHSSNIVTVRNGISNFVVTPSRQPSICNLIMVARDEHPKDYDTLFKALLSCKFDRCLVVGKGTDSQKFKTRAAKYAGDAVKRIDFLGLRTDVSDLLSSASIFVLCSEFEGLPISIIEAMAKGLPIVASDVGGVSELVAEGVNGYLVRVKDHQALARRLSELAEDPILRVKMGKNSLRRFEQEFTVQKMGQKVIDIYKEALNFSAQSHL